MNLSDSRIAGQPRIARLSASEAVLADLRMAIQQGDLTIGTRLPSEATMAAQYGVSRSVVREALRSCETLGLTKTQTGKGTFVASLRAAGNLTMGEFSSRDLVEARPHIEVPAAGMAAQRRTQEQCNALRDLVESMATTEDPLAWVLLDANFHAAIAAASQNRVFESVQASIGDALSRQSETLNLVAHRRASSNREHLAILEAIEVGSADDAAQAMTVHLNAVNDALQALLDETLHSS